ncbi:LuxR C-terminal-related transcriptional regulator [Nitratireductor sp. StC3]|uniref:helix-turn-helix transcriptional regulator n=1 Tax=Nitratireductor sp. StC3 TaxID=2126741 RepID=UPI000D0CD207|nr:LuxR C-terminal-related transcriptional regulator [Nitratireductor sp. StC3]PSM17629.1 helix-turn-helix transcriptional regulator [Nitratireductor sp. StC3]
MREKAENISEFLLGLYANAAEASPDEFRRQTLRRLGGLIAFDFALWGGGRAEDRRVSDLTALGQTPRVIEDWSAVADTDAFCDIALNRIGQTARFDDVENYRRTPAYNEHWKRFGARQMMATIAAEPQDGYVSFVGLCADTETAVFCDAARRLKHALMPHLSAALRINRQTTLCRHADRDEAVGLIGRDGWVLASHGCFTELLRGESDRPDRLPAALRAALPTGSPWQGRTVAAIAERLGEHYLLRLRHLGPLARLTGREREIAQHYVDGLTYREIATALRIAPSTVRNHIFNLYGKLDIASKIELARLCGREADAAPRPDVPHSG